MKKEKHAGKGTVKAVSYLLIVLILAGMVVYLSYTLQKKKEPEVTGSFISNQLETMGELTSAKMIYNGLIQYSEGSIPLLTKKAFHMTYRAELRAGVDLTKAETKISETQVTVTLPEVEILDISIDENSIQYYDEKSALLNWEKKEDAIDAISKAKEDVQENGDLESLKKMARDQAQVIVKGMLQETCGEKELVVRFA